MSASRLCCLCGAGQEDATGCMGWQGSRHPAPIMGLCLSPHHSPGCSQHHQAKSGSHSANSGFSLLPLCSPCPCIRHIVCLPSRWKSPLVPSLWAIYQQEQHNSLFAGLRRPRPEHPGAEGVPHAELGAGRTTGHCTQEAWPRLCSYHGRQQAASCRKGPHHGGSRTGPYAAFHQHCPGPSLQTACCLHTWLH